MVEPPAVRDAAAAAELVRQVAEQIRASPASALAAIAAVPGEPSTPGAQPIFKTTAV